MNKLTFFAVLFSVCTAFGGGVSAPTFVHLTPETSSFWHTATNHALTVPVTFPRGASSATLTVRGTRYARKYAGITGPEFSFSLPEASDLSKEDVYSLTLSFDDGTVRTARIALVQGLLGGAWGSTRCLREQASGEWRLSQGNGVLPVPHGASGLKVGGAAVTDGDRGFTGVQGWYALGRFPAATPIDLELTVGDVTTVASGIRRANAGALLLVR